MAVGDRERPAASLVAGPASKGEEEEEVALLAARKAGHAMALEGNCLPPSEPSSAEGTRSLPSSERNGASECWARILSEPSTINTHKSGGAQDGISCTLANVRDGPRLLNMVA